MPHVRLPPAWGTSIGSSINISTDAGAQIASDVGKGVIRGVTICGQKTRTR
ncbi:conjugative transposon protein TraM [Bacteroides thetaiotaomicron]|nr:conjugative transposon protein TraM [Bacteroides thetaiotaomicron]